MGVSFCQCAVTCHGRAKYLYNTQSSRQSSTHGMILADANSAKIFLDLVTFASSTHPSPCHNQCVRTCIRKMFQSFVHATVNAGKQGGAGRLIRVHIPCSRVILRPGNMLETDIAQQGVPQHDASTIRLSQGQTWQHFCQNACPRCQTVHTKAE
jgi:hypothetical protein